MSCKKHCRFLIILFLFAISIMISGCVSVTLPDSQMPVASKIYDSSGNVITTLFKQNRVQIPIEDIPEVTQQAFIAVEDARFYDHFGLDPIRIAASALNNIKAGRIVEGGSTITQQTAKNLYLSREKTFGRKFSEAWLAIQLEKKYTKKEILEIYLNQIYFGQGAYGIETASQTYFGKPASKLDLAESALLAGLPKAPNTYSPFQNWEGAKKRQNIVLKRMVETGFIKREEADKASGENLILGSKDNNRGVAPYVTNEVIKYITDKYENGAQMLFTEGISVYTSIDLEMQKAADESFNKVMSGKDPSLEGTLIAIDPSNGYIKAMVGGRDFSRSKFNRAFQAKRQPGSAFKPFLYTAAIDKGYTQGSALMCEYTEFDQGTGTPYKPTDYGANPYHNRPFILREALAVSDNIVSVKLANEIGPEAIVEYAKKMGIQSDLRPYLSLALGTSEVTPLEITSAYATLASGGIKTEPLLITKIVDRDGKTVEQNEVKAGRVIPDTTAYLVTDMLSAVLQQGGTAASLKGIFPKPAAGKTGTTQDYRDAWFVGYTPQLATGVYIGYDSPNKSVGLPGGKIAGPIWAGFMAKALANEQNTGFLIPDNIIKVQICADSGLLATPYSEGVLTGSYVLGTEPKQYCGFHSYGKVDPWKPRSSPRRDNDLPGNENYNEFGRRIIDWFSR